MADAPLQLELDGATVLEVIAGSGRIEVTADNEPGLVTVEGLQRARRGCQGQIVQRDGRRWVIHPRRSSRSLQVRCPANLNVTLSTRSGRISVQGPLGEVRASTISGRIEAAAVESLSARTRSGRIHVRDCEGRAKLAVMSGRVQVERAGAVELLAMSGRVKLNETAGEVKALAVSGAVQVQTDGGGDVAIATISGNIRVHLPAEIRPCVLAKQMSGKLNIDTPEGDDIRLQLRTVSGNIAVGSA